MMQYILEGKGPETSVVVVKAIQEWKEFFRPAIADIFVSLFLPCVRKSQNQREFINQLCSLSKFTTSEKLLLV